MRSQVRLRKLESGIHAAPGYSPRTFVQQFATGTMYIRYVA